MLCSFIKTDRATLQLNEFLQQQNTDCVDKEFELNYVHEQHQLAVELLSLGLSVLMDIFEIIWRKVVINTYNLSKKFTKIGTDLNFFTKLFHQNLLKELNISNWKVLKRIRMLI